eukprot:3865687-Prymnesium_polylepis.1
MITTRSQGLSPRRQLALSGLRPCPWLACNTSVQSTQSWSVCLGARGPRARVAREGEGTVRWCRRRA